MASEEARRDLRSPIRYLSMLLLAALTAQFLLGLWTNVESTPTTYPPTLAPHIALAYVLVLASLATLLLCLLQREPRLWVPSLLVVAGVVLASIEGERFLSDQNPLSSFGMGVGFLLSFSAATFLHSSTIRRASLRAGGDLSA